MILLKLLSFRTAQNATNECTEGRHGILDVVNLFDRHRDVERSYKGICIPFHWFPTSRE